MKLSPHFAIAEFGCKSGECVPDNFVGNLRALCATQLEPLRTAIGSRPIRIISGYRSLRWNQHVRGAPQSQHLSASAADIRVGGLSPEQLLDAMLEAIDKGRARDGGVGVYPSRPGRLFGWIHVDVGPAGRRWHG